MKLQVSGGIDTLTLIDEHGNTVCTFAKCDEEARQVAGKVCAAFNGHEEKFSVAQACGRMGDRIIKRIHDHEELSDITSAEKEFLLQCVDVLFVAEDYIEESSK